ncbi:MAG: site-specific integrase, partial [Microbacteriaceae bacterium]|nr:site-specific integrase [Microbacteriaceae bacterium]
MSLEPKSESPRPLSDLERELARYIRYVTLERGRSANTVSAYRSDLERYCEFLYTQGVVSPS